VKVDSLPPVATVGGSDPTPATDPTGEKPAQVTASPASPGARDVSPSSSVQQAQQFTVSYQLAENGHKVYFKVIDDNSRQVIFQAPPSAVLSRKTVSVSSRPAAGKS
jgi:hypothetical protein